MGISTTNYRKGIAKSIKMEVPKPPILDENIKKGFRRGMKEKLLRKLKGEQKQ